MTIRETNRAGVIPLRPLPAPPGPAPSREPLWRDLVGEVLRRERRSQGRTLKDVAAAARISTPYLSEVERGRKEASSEVLAAAAQALGLTLADLLALTGGELVRLSAARPRSTGRPGRAGRPAGPGTGAGATGTVRLAA
ncbi:helix-turn-helix domain-containing protein [Streptomyces sp. SID8359]|uniref:helix-turn-helix domain-containing protein n=1 Tax=unclassified Streptomyces TaxID=2593676 RepID=UPI0005169361|nr:MULTISPECIES: helix-turn-helix transcriptional regulator [unclassified Streptomyces]MYT93633.1 helix-turn-helix domain-containing protein [Streptomyces sp. SID8359]